MARNRLPAITVNDFLSHIVADKRAELEKRRTSLAEIKNRAAAGPSPHDFAAPLMTRTNCRSSPK